MFQLLFFLFVCRCFAHGLDSVSYWERSNMWHIYLFTLISASEETVKAIMSKKNNTTDIPNVLQKRPTLDKIYVYNVKMSLRRIDWTVHKQNSECISK